MGEIAERLIEGEDCETCGMYIGRAVGHSRSCCDENHPFYLHRKKDLDDPITETDLIEMGIKIHYEIEELIFRTVNQITMNNAQFTFRKLKGLRETVAHKFLTKVTKKRKQRNAKGIKATARDSDSV